MYGDAEAALVEQARGAASGGDWPRAYDLLVGADVRVRLSVDDLGFLAETAYAAGHLDVTIEAWERAHAEAVRLGDPVAAAGAAARVALHLLMDTALMAPIRGWVKRAERLLVGHDATPVHAWLAVIRSYERLMMGDIDAAREWAGRAVAVGSACNPAAAALGRVAEAHAVILEGDVRRGLELVDEAAVATISGELDALSTGMLYCELVCMLQGLAQHDLAEEWTEAMERWRHGKGIGSIHGRCGVHRAEILRLRGASAEAEQVALAACAELRPYLRREFGWPLTELGRVRFQLGDLRGAEEAFLAAREAGWDPEPGLALVRLAQGDVALAAASIRDALEHPLTVPSRELPPNTGLRRAPLLAARVEIEVAAGDLIGARDAADELARVAALFESRALAAGAAMADGRVRLAAGEVAGARHAFQTAVRLWSQVGAPHEVALARTGLAHAHRAAGDEAGARLELAAASVAVENLGAGPEADRNAHAAGGGGRKLPAGSPPWAAPSSPAGTRQAGDRKPDPNAFRREGDYWFISFEDHTVALRDLKGLHYLARLLAHPGREFHVLDLVASGVDPAAAHSGTPDPELTPSGWGDAGALLDDQAKNAYRRRLAEIDEDLEEARLMRDSGRVVQAEAERGFLIRELSRAVGLSGRGRRAGSASERARVSVTRAVRHAMARIRQYDPPLGEHLERAIRTGTYCVYLPDSRVTGSWRI
jgi:tetratricopeptide (TPR) repeat protein